jgi:hypothetical protein
MKSYHEWLCRGRYMALQSACPQLQESAISCPGHLRSMGRNICYPSPPYSCKPGARTSAAASSLAAELHPESAWFVAQGDLDDIFLAGLPTVFGKDLCATAGLSTISRMPFWPSGAVNATMFNFHARAQGKGHAPRMPGRFSMETEICLAFGMAICSPRNRYGR